MIDNYTLTTKENLEQRFEMAISDIYFAHQPIYGFRTPFADTSNIARYMVTASILNAFGKYSFSNFVDIGAAEGYTANLVKNIFKVPVRATDLSTNACRMAKMVYNIEAYPADVHHLPFNDNEFEAVLCSETLEHVTDYRAAITELLRICSKVLVITVPHETPEIVAQNIAENKPHGHIHYFDINTLDYLREMGYSVEYEKTLSPLLILPRVIVEGFKKHLRFFPYNLYNVTTPFWRRIFSIKSANRLVDLDVKFTKLFNLYGGITFTITKKCVPKREKIMKIKAREFTNQIVDPVNISNLNHTNITRYDSIEFGNESK